MSGVSTQQVVTQSLLQIGIILCHIITWPTDFSHFHNSLWSWACHKFWMFIIVKCLYIVVFIPFHHQPFSIWCLADLKELVLLCREYRHAYVEFTSLKKVMLCQNFQLARKFWKTLPVRTAYIAISKRRKID